METRRLPVDAIAATLLGGLIGSLFVILDGPETDPVAGASIGGVIFGTFGVARWIRGLIAGGEGR